MPLFQQLAVDGINNLIDIHLCPFCIMRYCNVEDKALLYFCCILIINEIVYVVKKRLWSTLLNKSVFLLQS